MAEACIGTSFAGICCAMLRTLRVSISQREEEELCDN